MLWEVLTTCTRPWFCQDASQGGPGQVGVPRTLKLETQPVPSCREGAEVQLGVTSDKQQGVSYVEVFGKWHNEHGLKAGELCCMGGRVRRI